MEHITLQKRLAPIDPLRIASRLIDCLPNQIEQSQWMQPLNETNLGEFLLERVKFHHNHGPQLTWLGSDSHRQWEGLQVILFIQEAKVMFSDGPFLDLMTHRLLRMVMDPAEPLLLESASVRADYIQASLANAVKRNLAMQTLGAALLRPDERLIELFERGIRRQKICTQENDLRSPRDGKCDSRFEHALHLERSENFHETVEMASLFVPSQVLCPGGGWEVWEPDLCLAFVNPPHKPL
eukprot:TRINITY_DN6862_c0_g3_i1.p1 TRINITY_DN6862_c0_g3~~TRINITY_DN6862_c0_g3_i1.p1  ORF type:complete len:239 (-),score=48.08 TRINITY_DN6862_c0_g3_i1:799-1515(-)